MEATQAKRQKVNATGTLEAIRYIPGKLEILDQLLLPLESKYIPVRDTQDGWTVINKMQVRGAPAIGVVASLSLAVELRHMTFSDVTTFVNHVTSRLTYLVTSRPTAVNITEAEKRFSTMVKKMAAEGKLDVNQIKEKLLAEIERMQEVDIATNRQMGAHGAKHVLDYHGNKPITALTHCNTGSLATAGYGTALGVVRALHEQGKCAHCYCTETRPYSQGSRLTAYELVYDKIPSTLICDSMVAMLMQKKGVNAVFVGADRVVSNGDTANKIGTFQIAIVAKHNNVPFYVVAPSTSIDLSLETGAQIKIEERPRHEMTSVKGIEIAAPGIGVWNPAFDVTPAELITGGIVTEFGVFSPAELRGKLTTALKKQ